MSENSQLPNDGHDGTNSCQQVRIDENQVVNILNEKIRESERPYGEIGKFLLDKYFGGNPEKVRSKDPRKDASFRKLAKRPDLLRSFSWLHKVLAVTIQDNLFSQNGIDASAVSYSIKAEIVSLPDDEKMPLIEKAINEHLSVREIRRAVREVKQGLNAPGVSDSLKLDRPKLEKSLTKLKNVMEDLNPWLETIAVDLGTMDLEAMETLYAEVAQGQATLKELDNSYSILIKALRDNMAAAAGRKSASVPTSTQPARECPSQ